MVDQSKPIKAKVIQHDIYGLPVQILDPYEIAMGEEKEPITLELNGVDHAELLMILEMRLIQLFSPEWKDSDINRIKRIFAVLRLVQKLIPKGADTGWGLYLYRYYGREKMATEYGKKLEQLNIKNPFFNLDSFGSKAMDKSEPIWTCTRQSPKTTVVRNNLTGKEYLIFHVGERHSNETYHLQGMNPNHTIEFFEEPKKRKNQRFTNPLEFTKETLFKVLMERGVPVQIVEKCL